MPELNVALDGQMVSLQQRVYDQVTRSVFEWPVWNELLNKVQKDGTVRAASVEENSARLPSAS